MEKPASEKKQIETPPSKSPSSANDSRNKELIEATERVYRRYGSDLPAFYRDVQKERELGRSSQKIAGEEKASGGLAEVVGLNRSLP
jgi:hypothetical protein